MLFKVNLLKKIKKIQLLSHFLRPAAAIISKHKITKIVEPLNHNTEESFPSLIKIINALCDNPLSLKDLYLFYIFF